MPTRTSTDRLPAAPDWSLELRFERFATAVVLANPVNAADEAVHGVPIGLNNVWLRAGEPLQPKGTGAQVQFVALEIEVHVESEPPLLRNVHVEIDVPRLLVEPHGEAGEGIPDLLASGMVVAAVGVFLPVYLFVIIPAPYFRQHRDQPIVKGFVEGVSAAATGAIAGADYVLATRSLVDLPTVLIAVATFAVLTRWRISELWLIAGAAVMGLLIRA